MTLTYLNYVREVLQAITRSDFRPELLESIIRTVSPEMNQFIRSVLSQPLSRPQSYTPILNLISIAFGLGFTDSVSIVSSLLTNLPELEINDYEAIQ